MNVPFYRHDLTADDAVAVANVLQSPFLTSGNVGRDVEERLCAYFGTKHALLVNSWTNGAAAVLLALDIAPGDEIIVPAQTFIATANVAELIGAKAVFVDVDPATLLMRPDLVRAAVTRRTRAIIPVHLYGQMVDIAALQEVLSDRPDIVIIEDAAHCFEGELNGEKPGTRSGCAIFSFYATKNVTCGEGGAVVTNDTALYERLLQTRMHGMSAGAIDRFKLGGYRHWDMEKIGMKANLPDLLACLLPSQIDTIDARLPRRDDLFAVYERAFADTPIRLPVTIGNSRHARHLFVIHVPPTIRDEAIRVFGENRVGVTVNYRAVPTVTYYKKKYGFTPGSYPVSETWGAGTISLPLFPSMTAEEQGHVIDTVRSKIVPMIEAAQATVAR
ncbi:DegT/DnrJ/EryC1/StrS family aminotransferase [Tardiphaga sp.]|uniref:DegT/DnrJ/EryC1/StrS family aminotransferase n=1 Tax=Tardiphaga sp. TaxID=1926292 RepID=UPI00352A9681